jgi:tRNA (mo5U34)-methyltransferase
MNDVEIEFRQMDVYNIAQLCETFDLVLFMGVLYHLRHPLLALDLLADHVVKDTIVVQSLLRGSSDAVSLQSDYPFEETEVFNEPGYPILHFVESVTRRSHQLVDPKPGVPGGDASEFRFRNRYPSGT